MISLEGAGQVQDLPRGDNRGLGPGAETLWKSFAILSDSLSSLLAIHNRRLETGYVQKFITDYSQLVNSGKTIILI